MSLAFSMGVLSPGSAPTNKVDKHHSHMDPSLWAHFAHAHSQEEYCNSWLALQCSLIPEVIQGLLVLGDPESATYAPVAIWPEKGHDPERLAELSERVVEERCGLLVELEAFEREGHTSPRYGVAYPLLIDERIHGLIAVEVSADSEDKLRSVMGQLQWGISWMELLFRRRQAQEDESSLERLKSAVDLFAAVLSVEAFQEACMTFVTELATLLKCDRVSIGFTRKNRIRIQAMSHSAQFGKHMNLIRAIQSAMDEAIFQRKEVFYPPPGDRHTLIVRDHEQLAELHGAGAILTMPFYGQEEYYGALTLERPAEEPFTDEEAAYCRSVASLLFPALEIKRQNDRPLVLKVAEGFKDQIVKLLGPRYPGRKLVALLVAAVFLFLAFKVGDYRVSADTILEGAVKRVVVAPFDGYIREAPLRAGDLVARGDVMCLMDDRDLRLERLNWISKRTQYERQYQEALAKHNRAEANILKAQLDQAAARLDLVESQLERTRIVAPFKGIILSGDLSQRLGGAVQKGEVLFEIAPLETYRVILQVDERRIADIREGQQGHMILSALPNEHFEFVVEKITPITTAKEGLNYFRVEARLKTSSDRLRPGMEGVGKIKVDRRKLIAIWTRDIREWLRLWIWSWWP